MNIIVAHSNTRKMIQTHTVIMLISTVKTPTNKYAVRMISGTTHR